MSIRMKLAIKYVDSSYFLLTILGKYNKINKRKVNLNGKEYIVNSIKICVNEKASDLFYIKFNKNIAMFVSNETAVYSLPITTTQHILAESSNEGMTDYLTIESSDGKDKHDIVYIPVLTAKNT